MKGALRTNSAGRESGSITFFVAALMLPALFLLFSLSLDVGKFYAEMDMAQKTIDDAVLFSYRYLPYAAEAKRAAEDYLAKAGYPTAVVQTSNEMISIRYDTLCQLSFTKLLGVAVEIPLPVFSEAVGTPFDISLLVDSSGYMAPDVFQTTHWGTESSHFYGTLYPRVHNNQLLDPQVLTEQCFNPLLSAVKRTAIGIYDYLSGSRLNAVGLSFAPGRPLLVDTARAVMPAGPRPDGTGEADLSDLNNTGLAGDELCAAIVQEEPYRDPQPFAIPGYTNSIARGWNPADGRDMPMILDDGWKLNPNYQPYMQAREVIWSRAAHSGIAASIDAIISKMDSDLVGAAILQSRGGLAYKARKSGIILTADVPRLGTERFAHGGDSVAQSMRESLTALRERLVTYKQDLRLYYLVFHNGLAFEEPDMQARIANLRSFFAELEAELVVDDKRRLELRVLDADDPDELARGVMTNLVLDNRNAMISR